MGDFLGRAILVIALLAGFLLIAGVVVSERTSANSYTPSVIQHPTLHL